jgi:hypothetical protein
MFSDHFSKTAIVSFSIIFKEGIVKNISLFLGFSLVKNHLGNFSASCLGWWVQQARDSNHACGFSDFSLSLTISQNCWLLAWAFDISVANETFKN